MIIFPTNLSEKENPNKDDFLLISDHNDSGKPKKIRVGSISGGAYPAVIVDTAASSYTIQPLTWNELPIIEDDTTIHLEGYDNSLAQEYIVSFVYTSGSITLVDDSGTFSDFHFAGAVPIFQSGLRYELHIVRGWITWAVFELEELQPNDPLTE